MQAVRISHSISSKGCAPALVNSRLTVIPCLLPAASAPGPQNLISVDNASRSNIVRLQIKVGLPQHDLLLARYGVSGSICSLACPAAGYPPSGRNPAPLLTNPTGGI